MNIFKYISVLYILNTTSMYFDIRCTFIIVNANRITPFAYSNHFCGDFVCSHAVKSLDESSRAKSTTPQRRVNCMNSSHGKPFQFLACFYTTAACAASRSREYTLCKQLLTSILEVSRFSALLRAFAALATERDFSKDDINIC